MIFIIQQSKDFSKSNNVSTSCLDVKYTHNLHELFQTFFSQNSTTSGTLTQLYTYSPRVFACIGITALSMQSCELDSENRKTVCMYGPILQRPQLEYCRAFGHISFKANYNRVIIPQAALGKKRIDHHVLNILNMEHCTPSLKPSSVNLSGNGIRLIGITIIKM